MYSAEEKRALALFNYEEKAAREARLMAEFQAMLQAQQQQQQQTPAAAGGEAKPAEGTAGIK